MSNTDAILATDAAAVVGVTTQAEKRKRWFEVGLVLLIAFGGSTLYSLNVLKNGLTPQSSVSTVRWAILALQEGTALLLLAYVLSRRSLTFGSIGLRWSPKDVATAILVAGISYVAYAFGYSFISLIQHMIFGGAGNGVAAKDVFGRPSIAIAAIFCVLNPLFEELIVRAYLMTEIIELTGSSALAVFLSVVVQFSYHLYYGWAGAMSLSFSFLVSAVYFAYWRRAFPIVIAHGFFDAYGMLRLLAR